jgi:hypothetical protein
MKSAHISILILILLTIYWAVKPMSIEKLMANAAAAAESKPSERATKIKDVDEANRRLMALSEEDRRSAFRRILALAGEQCVEIARTFYHKSTKQWNVKCRGGTSYVLHVESPKVREGN